MYNTFSVPAVSQMLWLQLFGGCTLALDSETLSGPAVQHRRLALLAILAGFRRTDLSRDKLSAYFWPEEDRDRARHFLADSLFTIRKGLGKDLVLAIGADLRLNADAIRTDIWSFEDHCASGDFASAAALYKGPFLDGFFISNAPEFERWVDTERERLGKLYADCLEQLARKSESAADYNAAAVWWGRLAVHDPYSSRVAVRTMEALEKAGDSVAAVKHAERYEKLIRDELDSCPDRSVLALAKRLRSRSPDISDETPADALAPPQQSARVKADQDVPAVPMVTDARQPGTVSVRRTRHIATRYGPVAAIVVVALAATLFAFRNFSRIPGAADTRPVAPATSRTSRPLLHASMKPSAREEAEELTHRGRLAFSFANPHGLSEGMSLFQKAIDIDPKYAPAYAGMADGYKARSDWAHAKAAARKALSLDSTLAEGYMALAGVLAYGEHRWLAADSALGRAIRLSPHYAPAHMRRAYVYAALGRADEALASAERARANDPESWNVLYNRGLILFAVNRPVQAIPLYEAALALKPDELSVKVHLAWAYRATGQNDAADALVRSLGGNTSAIIVAGDTTSMKLLLHRFETDSLEIGPSAVAIMYAWLGKNDAAFRQLSKATRTPDKLLPLHMRQEPLVRLSHDPRYQKVLADLGLR